jgi:adenylate cyclase
MESAPLKRRLTAVLLADVVGYSRLMGRDEEGTHRRLVRLDRELIAPRTAHYGGRVIRSIGDGLLVGFDSALAAVRCGLEIQRGLAAYNNDATADEPPIQLRIGINTGDVIVDERDIYGNSVNLAARLEGLAEPGAVYVSANVYDQLRGNPDLAFADRGYRRVKNIDHPIRVFRVDAVARRRPTFLSAVTGRAGRLLSPIFLGHSPAWYLVALAVVVAGTLGLTRFPIWHLYWPPWRPISLIVLPFRNLSNDPGQDYLADAVTDDLTTDLSRLRDVLVISPPTALTFKGKTPDLGRISREIGVRYAVEGSIRRVGPRVVTNARLIEAGSGAQIWADHFEDAFVDLIKLEDAITGRIANSLDVQLIRAESRRTAQVAQPDALDLRLRAEGIFLSAVTPEHDLAARRLLEQSVHLDPNSAEAWARLAEITASDYLNHWNNTGPDQLREAETAVKKALALDPDLALAHFANGFIHRARGEHQAALAAFDRAIALDPNFALAYKDKGDELILLGHPDEAPPLVEKAIALSPRDPSLGIFYWVAGRAEFYAGRYREAIPWLTKSIEVRPNLWYNRLYLASAYALLGDTQEAQKVLQDFQRHFTGRRYTVALVESFERTNPSSNPTVVAARDKFHQGLLLAGMPAR